MALESGIQILQPVQISASVERGELVAVNSLSTLNQAQDSKVTITTVKDVNGMHPTSNYMQAAKALDALFQVKGLTADPGIIVAQGLEKYHGHEVEEQVMRQVILNVDADDIAGKFKATANAIISYGYSHDPKSENLIAEASSTALTIRSGTVNTSSSVTEKAINLVAIMPAKTALISEGEQVITLQNPAAPALNFPTLEVK